MIDYDPGRVNREQWLSDMANLMRPMFRAAGMDVPTEVRVSCGWTSKGGKGKAALSRMGECWSPASSSAGFHEIFLSPIWSDSVEVAATLAHELIHASIGVDKKHGRVFGKFARALGFTGPMKSTPMTDPLRDKIVKLVEINGAYPHAKMAALTNGKMKQKARMLKVSCLECGYTVRIAEKWINEGMPTCPCGELMAIAEGNEDSE